VSGAVESSLPFPESRVAENSCGRHRAGRAGCDNHARNGDNAHPRISNRPGAQRHRRIEHARRRMIFRPLIRETSERDAGARRPAPLASSSHHLGAWSTQRLSRWGCVQLRGASGPRPPLARVELRIALSSSHAGAAATTQAPLTSCTQRHRRGRCIDRGEAPSTPDCRRDETSSLAPRRCAPSQSVIAGCLAPGPASTRLRSGPSSMTSSSQRLYPTTKPSKPAVVIGVRVEDGGAARVFNVGTLSE